MSKEVERFVKANKEFFILGYPLDFISLNGFGRKGIAIALRSICEEPKRIRTTSKEAKRLQEEYNKLDNPNGIPTNIYTPGNEKMFRVYKLIPREYESEDEYEEEEDQSCGEAKKLVEEIVLDEKQKLLCKFNNKLSNMTLEELRALYCNLF